jgi:hypothetical protein
MLECYMCFAFFLFVIMLQIHMVLTLLI